MATAVVNMTLLAGEAALCEAKINSMAMCPSGFMSPKVICELDDTEVDDKVASISLAFLRSFARAGLSFEGGPDWKARHVDVMM